MQNSINNPPEKVRISDIVRELEIVGPDVTEIAERLGQPVERVAYTFRSNVSKNGYVVQARPNRQALGLKIVAAVVDISPRYASRVNDIFAAMDELWYLSNFVRTDPSGSFILQFALPEESCGDFPELLNRMEKIGLVSEVHMTLEYDQRRLRRMNAENFDFRRGRWNFDWSRVTPETDTREAPKTNRQEFDLADLSIITYLMVNAFTPIREIARISGISPGSAYRHMRHVKERELIEDYGIYWTKEHLNEATGTPFRAAHKYVMDTIVVKGATSDEQARLSRELRAIPFLWGEYVGRDYCAELALPPDQLVEGFSYIGRVLSSVSAKASSFMLDPAYGYSFTPPRKVFDDESGQWIFDLDAQMERLRQELTTVRQEARIEERFRKHSPGGRNSGSR